MKKFFNHLIFIITAAAISVALPVKAQTTSPKKVHKKSHRYKKSDSGHKASEKSKLKTEPQSDWSVSRKGDTSKNR